MGRFRAIRAPSASAWVFARLGHVAQIPTRLRLGLGRCIRKPNTARECGVMERGPATRSGGQRRSRAVFGFQLPAGPCEPAPAKNTLALIGATKSRLLASCAG